MVVYLARFEANGRVAYKVGYSLHTYDTLRRFDTNYDERYGLFNIEMLEKCLIEAPEYQAARAQCELVEGHLKARPPFKKNIYVEKHFGMPYKSLDGLSGITEMFALVGMTEEELINTFRNECDAAFA